MVCFIQVAGRYFCRAAILFFAVCLISPAQASAFEKGKPGSILKQLENEFTQLAEKVLPAVVSLSPHVGGDPDQKRFGGLSRRRPTNSAAGVIVDGENGWVVTNSHVVRDAVKIKVTLYNGQILVGRVVGKDEDADLAVVKIDSPDPLPSAKWADSSAVKVGQLVVAVGNPYGLNETMTFGIVSGLNRENINLSRYEDFIQTDASINPGNSGGPLLNIEGNIIGINTAIINYAQNIGFAIPSNVVKDVVTQLIEFGEVRRGWLGVGIEPLPGEPDGKAVAEKGRGVFVNSAFKGDPAYDAGVRKGDVILKVAGVLVDSPTKLIRMVGQVHPGQKINIEVLRDGKNLEFTVELGERKKELFASLIPEEFSSLGFDVENQAASNSDGVGGVVVSRVESKGQAMTAGLQAGDLISEVQGKAVSSKEQFENLVGSFKDLEQISLLVVRNQESIHLTLLLKE